MSCTQLLMEVESTLYSYRSKNASTGCQQNCKQEIKLINESTRNTKVTQIYLTFWLQLSNAMTLGELNFKVNTKFAKCFNDTKTIR